MISSTAAKKFELAFGLTGVEDAVSRYHGIDSQSGAKTCTQTSECDSALGQECSKRTGKTSGKCIATWFGICHAWAPAALMYKEPEQEVDFGGQHFKINDIKGLLTLANNNVDSKFVSLRCNTAPHDVELDGNGRPTDPSCRYTNPATYHLILANFLGLRHEGFVEDRTFSAEVWNQPVRGFKVLNEREVSVQEANSLIGVIADGPTTEESDTVAKDAWKQFGPYTVAEGDSVSVNMTGNGDADLYVRKGAQATSSAYDCRPYKGANVKEECHLTGSASYYVSINGYSASSNYQLSVSYQ